MKRYLYIIMCLVFVACNDDDLSVLTPEQQALIGTAVNFDATTVDEFTNITRTTWNESGAFNERDLMRIFRQYDDDGDGTWTTSAYRTYYFYHKNATGTSIELGKDWRVYPGRKGYNEKADAFHAAKQEFTQKESDSLTWENGNNIRFRAWSRSNYAGTIGSDRKLAYYPDYCISDWVTASGPTLNIPLTLRHQTCRITIAPRGNGNQIARVLVCTDWQDYMRKDNADTSTNDESSTEHGKTEAEAKSECAQVVAAYNRMCMPAGVDESTFLLKGILKDKYKDITTDQITYLENQPAGWFYSANTKDASYIENSVQRPVFGNLNTYAYLITIPYDMSDESTHGELLNLPACTRFRVYLYDVNRGDGNPNTDNTQEDVLGTPNIGQEVESTYHIFSLSDIIAVEDNSGNSTVIYEKNDDGTDKTDANGNKIPKKLFPNGIDLKAGYSYKLWVGYRYNQLTVTASDNFSWLKQDEEEKELADQAVAQPEIKATDYGWWKKALIEAIPTGTDEYNPVFHITTQQEFLEFIKLVNGTATTKTSGLERARRYPKINEEKKDKDGNPVTTDDRYYFWYDVAATAANIAAGRRDTVWVTKHDMEEEGYIFYANYNAKDGDRDAFSNETYLKGPFSFYNENLNAHYTVFLDNDIDLNDWEIESIGNTSVTPFRGYFDGQMHKLTNVNMEDEYLFGHIKGAAIRNLKLESTHNLCLVNEGTGGNSIVGISLLANSSHNSIATKLIDGVNSTPVMSYVVGCIHVGDATGALVGSADNLTMLGCMNAAYGINNTGALLGGYEANSISSNFFEPQIELSKQIEEPKLFSRKPSWGRFLCNYYDTELSPTANAVGNIPDDYSPLEYIRGRRSGILKAKNDLLLSKETPYSSLNSDKRRKEYYGLAPWKAMNYAIYKYNSSTAGGLHPCRAHYENNSTGYVHLYPVLLNAVPTSAQYADPLSQNN